MNDILLDNTGDLSFKNGDLEIDYSDNQHQEHILVAYKGEFKQYPELGAGITQMIDDDDNIGLLIELKKNLEYDGMKVNNIKFEDNGILNIDGNY